MPAFRNTPAGDFDYEAHGVGYARRRRPDPRIAALVRAQFGDARTLVNVGAGAGSYEPDDLHVVAIEPSATMRAQRPRHLAPALDAGAEHLPFDDGAFDAALAAVTIHQWADVDAGLRELRRVTRGPVVVMTFDPDALSCLWLGEYVPEVIDLERRRFPAIDHVTTVLGGGCRVLTVPVPLDCTDGFGEAYYGRPELLLEPDVRASQSGWMLAEPVAVERGVRRLATTSPPVGGMNVTATYAPSSSTLVPSGSWWPGNVSPGPLAVSQSGWRSPTGTASGGRAQRAVSADLDAHLG